MKRIIVLGSTGSIGRSSLKSFVEILIAFKLWDYREIEISTY